MRDALLVLSALVLTGLAVYLTVTTSGPALKPWVVLVCAGVAALYAAGLVVMGETIIEDAIKVVMLLVPAVIAVVIDTRLLFVLWTVLVAGAVGVAINQLNRHLANTGRARNG